MSIIKFKDSNGQWKGIPAFKGENGKDGAIQYKAGDGIKIENDTITAEVTKQYVDKSIAELTDMGFTPEVVESLPTENIKTNIIYMLPAQTSEAENIYEEWMYINNKWEMIGSTSVDLTNYYTKNEANAKLDTKQNKLTPGENITIDENNVISASGGKTKFYSFYTGLQYNFQRPSNIYLSEMSVDNREKFKALLSNIITEVGTTENKDAMLLVQFQCSNYIQGLPYLIFSMSNNQSMDTTRTSFKMISIGHYANNRRIYQYSLEITGTWNNGVFNVSNVMFSKSREETFLSIETGLAKDNTTSYTPTSDYHPATKKYVDDMTKNINNELSMLPQNLVDNGFDYNTHEQVHAQVNYTIENISTSYGFELNGNGYYESNNKGVGTSCSLCKVTFNNEKRLLIPISYINSGENNYDYGIFSNVDKELSNGNVDDGATGSERVFKNCKGESSTDVKEITYEIPAGEHFIYIKYRKDDSGDNANDSLQFKIPTEIANDIYENRKMATTKYVDDAISNIDTSGGAKGYYYVEAPIGSLGVGNGYDESNTLPETCHQVFKDFIDTINSDNVREPKLIVANTVDETTDINGNPITNPMPRYIELSNLHKDTTAEEGKSHYILKGVCNTLRGAKNANGDDIDFIATVDIVGVDSGTGFTVENVFVYLGVYTMPSASSGKTNYLGYIEDYTPDNRLDITDLEKGTYSLGIKDRIGSQTLYLKVSHNGQEQTLNTTLEIESPVVTNMIYFDVRNPIKDISGYNEVIRIGLLYLNNNTGEIVNTKYGISYNSTNGKLSNSARYNGKISAVTTDTEQVIGGKKTFNVLPESSVEPTNGNQFVNKKYVDDSITNISTSGEVDLSNYYTKSEVDTSLSGKANTNHTHTKSEITDFPTIPNKTSELTNDSGFLTSHQDISGKLDTSTYNNKMSEIDSSINSLNAKSHQVLYGTETPASSLGNNGDIYIQYTEV